MPPIPIELITMLGGTFVGFLMKMSAEKEKMKQAQFERWMGTVDKKDESADKAVARVPIDAGKIVRRLIVACALFGTVIALFIAPLMDLPVIIQLTDEKSKYFFGMFGGGIRHQFVEVKGYLLITEVRQTLTALVGFYFGQAAGRVR
jgi:hypothetical protein